MGSNAKAHSVLKSTDSSSARSSIGTGTATGTGATTGAGNSNGKAGSSCSSSDTIGVSGHDLSLLQSRALERYRAVCGTKTVDTGEGVDGEILGSLGEGVGELLVSGSDDFTLFVWSPTVGMLSALYHSLFDISYLTCALMSYQYKLLTYIISFYSFTLFLILIIVPTCIHNNR